MLREFPWSESSQVVVLLTADHGKVRGLAKGSKRLSPSAIQRFSGGVELLTAGQVVAGTRRTAELAQVTEWNQQEGFAHLRRNLPAQWLAMYAAELTAALLGEMDRHPAVFDGLRRMLGDMGSMAPQAALLAYQWLLLNDCGYRPELQRDVLAGGPLAPVATYSFDPSAGGFTAENPTGSLRVRASTVMLLRRVAVCGDGRLLAEDPDGLRRANRLLCVYARQLLGHELNAMGTVLHAEGSADGGGSGGLGGG